MGFIIEDGKGTGKKARVDGQNRLVVNARSESIQHYTSQEEENAYQILNVIDFTPGTTVSQHITNNDPVLDMVVTYVRHQIIATTATLPSVNEYFRIAFGRTYASGGLEIKPVNVFNGSGNTADVTVYCSNPTVEGTAVEIDRWYTKAVGDMYSFNKEGSVVIKSGRTIEVSYVTSATGTLYTRVSFLMMPKN
jgi:hypothetical protein